MNSPQLASNQNYTVNDYLAWNDGQRYELLHGGVHAMSPAPSWQHQLISGNLEFEIKSHLRPRKICQIIYAPIDVYLSNDTVVQPDIIVVCDQKKIKKIQLGIFEDVIIDLKNIFEKDSLSTQESTL
jgi:Uma2 family endonuclease